MATGLFRLMIGLLLCLPVSMVSAQSLANWRGGWIADIDGQRHIFYVVIRNDTVSGVYCDRCEDPDRLAIIDDGLFDDQGLSFTLYHSPANSPASMEGVHAALNNGAMQVTITGDNGRQRNLHFHRTPEADKIIFPIADFAPNQQPGSGQRQLPGPAETVTADLVEGLWLWGTGPTKQYFIFKKHKGGLRGMVCGPCFSVNDMAPLEQISMNGSNLHFEIVHEDNGAGLAEHGPHSNVTDAEISRNEMHMSVHPSYDPDGQAIEMTLLGPVITGEASRF